MSANRIKEGNMGAWIDINDTDEVGRSLYGILRGLALKGDGKAQLFTNKGGRPWLFEFKSFLHLVTQGPQVCDLSECWLMHL